MVYETERFGDVPYCGTPRPVDRRPARAPLSRQACDIIKNAGWWDDDTWRRVTITGYVRHWYPDGRWHGDSCGCVDDRCIGHHHDATQECHCLPVWLDEYAAELRSGAGAAD